jgi:putrescine transport system ATP-binding protein
MAMASRIAVMSHGRVLQVGTPKEIYEHPNCRFVADFIGNVNMMEGELTLDEADRCEVTTAYGVVQVGHGISGSLGMAAAIAVRPEKIQISKTRPNVHANLFTGKVREIAYFGSYNTFIVETGAEGGASRTVKITETNTTRHESSVITWDDTVFFWWDDSAPVVLTQ